MTFNVAVFVAVAMIFFLLAKFDARPGFNAITLGIILAATPVFSKLLPGHGTTRDAATVFLMMLVATVGTALGGGLKARPDDHDHGHAHSDDHEIDPDAPNGHAMDR